MSGQVSLPPRSLPRTASLCRYRDASCVVRAVPTWQNRVVPSGDHPAPPALCTLGVWGSRDCVCRQRCYVRRAGDVGFESCVPLVGTQPRRRCKATGPSRGTPDGIRPRATWGCGTLGSGPGAQTVGKLRRPPSRERMGSPCGTWSCRESAPIPKKHPGKISPAA